ncbi:hypothetical protein BJV82DRAFT_632659 [Fennellomyces sp. T-0311]|nr:hypothetical protein BJV82DRAFT_632659 [Fennellomyces sp. T-0311]
MRVHILHLFLLILTAHYATAFIELWNFRNWNKYRNDKSDDTAKWRQAWGIPKSGGWSWPRKGSSSDNNHQIVDDPVNLKEQVLRVTYPAGSSNPAGSPQGGIGFYAQPITLRREAKIVIFEYQVYFPKNFQFVKGGKLPGLYGGHEGCSGGADADACFSTRFMWRREGDGEVYAYLPENKQRDDLCDDKENICNPDYGYSLGRGTWKFKTGKWTRVRQTLKLNTVGKMNGLLRVDVDGRNVYNENKLVFVNKETSRIVGVAFHTFFGGSGSSWAPKKKEYSYFKRFKLSAFY